MTADDYVSSCTWFIHDLDSNKMLLQLRDLNKHIAYAGKWVFPGGNKKDDESPAECAKRELREELGLSVPRLEEVMTLYHHSHKIAEHFYYVPIRYSELSPAPHEGEKWMLFDLDSLDDLEMGWWSKEVIPILRRYLRELR